MRAWDILAVVHAEGRVPGHSQAHVVLLVKADGWVALRHRRHASLAGELNKSVQVHILFQLMRQMLRYCIGDAPVVRHPLQAVDCPSLILHNPGSMECRKHAHHMGDMAIRNMQSEP